MDASQCFSQFWKYQVLGHFPSLLTSIGSESNFPAIPLNPYGIPLLSPLLRARRLSHKGLIFFCLDWEICGNRKSTRQTKEERKHSRELFSLVPICPVSLQLRFFWNSLVLTSIHHSNPQQFTGGDFPLPAGDFLTSEVKTIFIHATELGIWILMSCFLPPRLPVFLVEAYSLWNIFRGNGEAMCHPQSMTVQHGKNIATQ